MPVEPHDLDLKIFEKLSRRATKEKFKNWQGKASDIDSYIATWGVVRFWALSLSKQTRGNQKTSDNECNQNYYAWEVAREVLCTIIGGDFKINACMNTEQFQNRYKELSDVQQLSLLELLIEIASTIQFWTMRIKDSLESEKNNE